MELKDQKSLFDKLYELYQETKTSLEPFTFWTTSNAGKGLFNRGADYLNVGIVKITSNSHLQLAGFSFNPDSFKEVKLSVENRPDDIQGLKNQANKIHKPLTDIQITSFLKDISSIYSSWKYSTTVIDDNLIKELKKEYESFFEYIKSYDANNSTCFYEILKIDANTCDKKMEKTNEKIKKWISEGEIEGQTQDDDSKDKGMSHSHPLNLILYGPPGTGKTYNTLFKALEIIEGKTKKELEKEKKDQDDQWEKDTNKPKTVKKGYEVLKGRYDNYVKTGQIVFTTFHQSMSYEDFIEGIKPSVEGDEMTYEVQDGIFKKLCKSASNEYYDVDFDKCYNDFVSKLGGRLKLKSSGGKEFYVDLNSKGNLNLYTTSKQNFNGVLTKEKIKQTLLGKEDYWKGYMMGVINHLKKKYGLKDPQKVDEKRNYVLIIDEINRGNVAQIFGELITLIEPSKRLGNSEEMKAILPYSSAQKGEPEYFGVPNNLYIIGTMNTADRSVEALDTALRRRFSFEEMMPKPELLTKIQLTKGDPIDLKEVLEKINDRIIVLKDREHQIGHSYFMGHDDKNEDGSDKYQNKEEWLTNVFKDKIIPLLQEYFYGDYKKIYYVLGPGFVENSFSGKNQDSIRKELFPFVDSNDQELDISEERYEIRPFNDDPNDKRDNKVVIKAAVHELINSEEYQKKEKDFKEKHKGTTFKKGDGKKIDVKYVIERTFGGENISDFQEETVE